MHALTTLLRWLGLIGLLALAAVAGPARAARVHADTTNMAVIACENLAPYLDGDADDATTQADLDLACKQPLPATGALSIATLETAVGTPDGRLTYFDVLPLDALDNNRIPVDCTYQAVVVDATKAAEGCTLVVMVFVDDEAPVGLGPAALTTIDGNGAGASCIAEGSGFALDNDCSANPNGNGDGVVVFHVLNDSAADGDAVRIDAIQQAVQHTAVINVSSDTRNDPNGDLDNDGVPYPADNCTFYPNADQVNTDNAPIITPGVAAIDTSIPNSDTFGDACDLDDDNDALYDGTEIALGVSGPPGGGAVCGYAYYPGGTDPLVADTDGDRVLDGAECRFGSDPTDPASRPQVFDTDMDGDGLPDVLEGEIASNPNAVDTDGDGITDGVEFRGYNTSLTSADTDGDGCDDDAEIASVDSNSAVNALDLQILAQSFMRTDRAALDINKDGQVNVLDLQIVALNFQPAPCDLSD